MLSDIIELDSKIIRTIKRNGVDIDPGDSFTVEDARALKKTWADKKTDPDLIASIKRLDSAVRKMYYLCKAHSPKSEISEYITRYNRIAKGLVKIGSLEPDFIEGKA